MVVSDLLRRMRAFGIDKFFQLKIFLKLDMAASTDYLEQKINKHVASTHDFNELSSILRCIPFETMQKFATTEFQKLDLPSKQNIFWNLLPMNDLLPDDTIQHILSFDGRDISKLVNKKFNRLCKINERIQWNQAEEALKAFLFDHNNQFNQEFNTFRMEHMHDNKTWIVDESRTVLNDEEIKRGYYGPLNDLDAAINHCNDGDTILVHDGDYAFLEGAEFDKNIQIIGVGDEVNFDVADDKQISIGADTETAPRSVSFQNIQFYFLSEFFFNTLPGINVCHGWNLWMKGCNFHTSRGSRSGIHLMNNANLNIVRCHFLNTSCAVKISCNSGKINVGGCSFSSCGRGGDAFSDQSVQSGCICIDGKDGHNIGELKCIGNLFAKNSCYPIAEYQERKKNDNENEKKCVLINTDRCFLSHNLSKGDNATKFTTSSDYVDGNRLYLRKHILRT